MRILFKGVGKPVRALTISNNPKDQLKEMQMLVGGDIEAIQLTSNVMMVCNERGKPMGLGENFRLWNDIIVGNVLFTGVGEEDFTDCPESEYGINTILEELR